MKITMLGCGTSVGVPSLGILGWGKCNPDNPKNRRQRSSVLIQENGFNILIDAGPDVRNQLLDNKIEKIDAVFFAAEPLNQAKILRALNQGSHAIQRIGGATTVLAGCLGPFVNQGKGESHILGDLLGTCFLEDFPQEIMRFHGMILGIRQPN